MNERSPNPSLPPETQGAPDDAMAPAPGRKAPPQPPDFGRGVSRFFKDEDGQSMVEFCVVMPIFLFLIMGIIQFMLIANASFFVNYGNFMALRTAAVRWEMSPVGITKGGKSKNKIPSNVRTEARNTLRYCLLPIAYLRGDKINSSVFLYQAKVNLSLAKSANTGVASDWIEGWSQYDYPLMIPLASNIIHAIAGGKQGSDDYYADVLPYDKEPTFFGITLPGFLSQLTLRIQSDSGWTGTKKGGSKTKNRNPHRELIQRRW